MKYKGLDKGFTLIELLVVISIIGLLSSVVLASLATARASARDSERIATIKQIQNALELYAIDNGGRYPGFINTTIANGESAYARSPKDAQEMGSGSSGCGYGAPGTPGASSPEYMPGIWCRLENALSPYIKKLPRTFVNNNTYYYYTYKIPSAANAPRFYGLSVKLERPNSVSQNDGGFSSTDFEVGQLPAYCVTQFNQDWNQWTGNPCQ